MKKKRPPNRLLNEFGKRKFQSSYKKRFCTACLKNVFYHLGMEGDDTGKNLRICIVKLFIVNMVEVTEPS